MNYWTKMMAVIFGIVSLSFSQGHMVLHEQFIDLMKGWAACGGQVGPLEDTANANPEKMALLYYFRPDELRTQDVDDRCSYYDFNFYNFMHAYDGVGDSEMYVTYNYWNWGSWTDYALETSYAKPKVIEFGVATKLIDSDSAAIQVSFEMLEEVVYTDLVLHVVVVEDGIPNTFPTGSLGDKIDTCNNIVRHMIPDVNGTLIGEYAVGDSGIIEVGVRMTPETGMNYDNCRFIGFIQGRESKVVYESFRIDEPPFQEYGEWQDIAVSIENNVMNLSGISIASFQSMNLDATVPEAGDYSIRISSISGRTLFEDTKQLGSGLNSLTGWNLSSGMYLVSLTGNVGSLSTKCVIP